MTTKENEMSKVTMPEPVAQQIRYFDSNVLSRTYGEWSEWKMFTGKYERMGMNQKRGLITTDQAEAYADARVDESQQWHPIETAPKDGTWVMAYRPPCEGIQMDTIVIVSWQDFEDEGSAWMWPDEPYDPTTEAGKAAALSLIASGNLYWDEEFTHWMPLPAPPPPGPASHNP